MDLFGKMKKIRRRHLCRLGIIPSHFHVLKKIQPGETLTLSEVSSRVRMENSNVTSIIDHLAGKGIVERYRDADDRRVVRVRLTSEGRSYRDEIIGKHEEFIADIYKNLKDSEIREFMDMVRLVSERIDKGEETQ